MVSVMKTVAINVPTYFLFNLLFVNPLSWAFRNNYNWTVFFSFSCSEMVSAMKAVASPGRGADGGGAQPAVRGLQERDRRAAGVLEESFPPSSRRRRTRPQRTRSRWSGPTGSRYFLRNKIKIWGAAKAFGSTLACGTGGPGSFPCLWLIIENSALRGLLS